MKKADVILLGVLLIIGITGCVIWYVLSTKGASVNVIVDGEETACYSLQSDGEYLIETENGGENLLRIDNGYVSVISANCPNRDCVHHKAISLSNESIVCLPHKVTITISDTAEKTSIDAYTR